MTSQDRVSDFASARARNRFLARYDRALEDLWPVPVDALDVEISAGVVRVYRAGPAAGTPVVLLAGAGGNALAWYRFVEPLARTRPVLALDPLGEAGRSVQHTPITTSADLGGWLTQTLEALDVDHAHLVGSSLGGATILAQQLDGGARASALTLIDPAGLAPVTGRFYRWIILNGLAALLAPRRLRHALAGRLGNGTLTEDALITLVRAGRTFRRRLPHPELLTDGQLQSLDLPVQVLLGAHSTLHHADTVAERLAEVVPSWRVEIVPDTGHALPVEAPQTLVERILTFPAPTHARPETDHAAGRP